MTKRRDLAMYIFVYIIKCFKGIHCTSDVVGTVVSSINQYYNIILLTLTAHMAKKNQCPELRMITDLFINFLALHSTMGKAKAQSATRESSLWWLLHWEYCNSQFYVSHRKHLGPNGLFWHNKADPACSCFITAAHCTLRCPAALPKVFNASEPESAIHPLRTTYSQPASVLFFRLCL